MCGDTTRGIMHLSSELKHSATVALIGPVVFIYKRINNRDELLAVPAVEEKEEEE